MRLRGRDPATGLLREVTVEDGRVAAVRTLPDAAAEATWLAPGLVDLQVNGYGGFDVNGPDVTAEMVVELGRALARAGTTTFVPTVVTAAEADIVRSLRAVVAARAADPETARAVPYVHVEGPHLSPEDGPRGAHPVEHVRPPDVAEYERWQQAADGVVGLVTVSPHYPEAVPYTRALTAAGTLVAVGHTRAEPHQVTAVVDAGAVLSTHLGNGADGMLPRHPNQVWTQLADDRLTAGFIADGHHLPADTLVAMLRAKGLHRAFLVSDATALAGLEPGRYRTPVGGEVELSTEGRLSYVGTPMLAGAACSLAVGVARVAGLGPFSLAEAIDLATASPGRFCGGRGALRVGAPADLVRFGWEPGATDLSVDTVVVAGRTVVSGR